MQRKRILLIVISLVGMAFMTYLSYLHFAPSASSFCEIGEAFSCEAVNKSIYSELFGVPVAFGGFAFFALMLFMGLRKFTAEKAQHVAAIAIMMLIPSLYMSGVSKFLIGKYCFYCELSKVLMALIVLLMLSIKDVRKNVGYLVLATVLGLVFAGAAYLNHQSLVPEGKYDTFVQCMYDNGVRNYGSATCAHCAKQRAMLGDSFELIHEVECNPLNEGADLELCEKQGIEGTPTWTREDENGNILDRLPPGEKELEVLAEFSGCELVEDN